MNKTRTFILYCCLICCGINKVTAQKGIVVTGGNASGTGGSVSYSVGQVAYTTIKDTTGTASAGVQQPFEIYVVTGIKETGIKLFSPSATVYPNPASEFITLKLENYKAENISYQLCDVQGKILTTKKADGNETKLSVAELTTAIYFFKVFDSNKQVKIFKIIKN